MLYSSRRNRGLGLLRYAERLRMDKCYQIKVNYAPLRSVPGVANGSTDNIGPLCRKCGRVIEIPAYCSNEHTIPGNQASQREAQSLSKTRG
ncbi:hypothetical protein O3M35_010571 [Rhynocoris fuscipes]|uniref:Uncharacterized protein n=1 Tax=Rhynocoris fuscipes TaxID=488301 RepID=A0AAW1D1R3_9HEMI